MKVPETVFAFKPSFLAGLAIMAALTIFFSSVTIAVHEPGHIIFASLGGYENCSIKFGASPETVCGACPSGFFANFLYGIGGGYLACFLFIPCFIFGIKKRFFSLVIPAGLFIASNFIYGTIEGLTR